MNSSTGAVLGGGLAQGHLSGDSEERASAGVSSVDVYIFLPVIAHIYTHFSLVPTINNSAIHKTVPLMVLSYKYTKIQVLSLSILGLH